MFHGGNYLGSSNPFPLREFRKNQLLFKARSFSNFKDLNLNIMEIPLSHGIPICARKADIKYIQYDL